MFTGREYLSSIAAYDYRHRTYRPNIGRFLQIDPIGFDAGDMNLFRYVGGDPVDRTDPTGLYDPNSSLTSMGGGDWSYFNGGVADAMREELQRQHQTASNEGGLSAGLLSGRDVNVPVGGFKSEREAGRAGAQADYDQIDKSGVGGRDRNEYGGLTLRRRDAEGHQEFGFTGPYKGKQGRVTDQYRTMRQANYFIVEGPGSPPVPRGWTKVGWHYAHPIPGNTIPLDDKKLAHAHGWSVAGAAPPLRRGAYYNPGIPIMDYYP